MLKLVLVLLGLKFLLPSKEQRKKRKKARDRRKRLLWLAAKLSGRKNSRSKSAKAMTRVKKKMGVLRKIKLAVKTLVFICISIPLIDLTLKGVKLGKKAYAMLPKKDEK